MEQKNQHNLNGLDISEWWQVSWNAKKSLGIKKQNKQMTKPETLVGFIPALQELQVYFS